MDFVLSVRNIIFSHLTSYRSSSSSLKDTLRQKTYIFPLIVYISIITFGVLRGGHSLNIISPIAPAPSVPPVRPMKVVKHSKEVFGFAPYWNMKKLDTIDFDTLTTLAYFSETIDQNGYILADNGYATLNSPASKELFAKAHAHGARVVLTVTQMDPQTIREFLDNSDAQQHAINQIIAEVSRHDMDGVNIDFEYVGYPGEAYRDAYSEFVNQLSMQMHAAVPGSHVSVSVLASSIKERKMYDIASLSSSTDAIFMMAYDFAVTTSEAAMPTAPMRGYKSKTYWYDVETAVEDFLTQMPANKLILGVPWYGYDYAVYTPGVNAQTRPSWARKGGSHANTYANVQNEVTAQNPRIDGYMTGWDDVGQVGYKAYHVADTNTWRMIFIEDVKSLGIKYDFAKSKNLAGVGMWALGMDSGKHEMWELLKEKFGTKLADASTGHEQN